MTRRGWRGWAAMAAVWSFTGGCSCDGGHHDPGAAGTTAGGAGVSGEAHADSGAGTGAAQMPDSAVSDSAVVEPDSAALAPDGGPLGGERRFIPTNDFEMAAHGVAWELDGDGAFLAVWREDPSTGPHPIVSGLARLPRDEQLGDAWYCVGEGSTFSPSAGREDRGEGSLRALTRLPDCATGDGTLAVSETGLRFQMTSSLPELNTENAQPLGARCADRVCDIYFSTLDAQGAVGFLIMHMETATPVGMAPLNPTSMPTEIESAYLALIRDDGTALLACASGGVMSRAAASDAIFSLTGMGTPVMCPGGAAGPSSLDFTTADRASSE